MVDTLLPPQCVSCNEIVEDAGLCPSCWGQMNFISRPYCDVTGIPFETGFEVKAGSSLPLVKEQNLYYDKARAVFVYDDASRKLILAFKHGDQTHYAKTFTHWLCRYERDIIAPADFICPVPLHWTRLVRRKFNQSQLLAENLANKFGMLCIPDLLERTKATKPQGKFKRKQRRQNVKGVFTVPEKYKSGVAGKTILIIDDVLTTGATVNECAKVLKKSGAAQVYILTLARVI